MAKEIRASAWRKLERPYTRKSRYRKKAYVRSMPHNKLVRFVMGNKTKEFNYRLCLVSKQGIQLRHNSLEAGRKSTNKVLETQIPQNYRFKVRVYPHHALRNNPLASGAGADRMSTGMQRSFGKVISIAAQVRKGKTVFEVKVDESNKDIAKEALHRARKKFPGNYQVVEEKIEN